MRLSSKVGMIAAVLEKKKLLFCHYFRLIVSKTELDVVTRLLIYQKVKRDELSVCNSEAVLMKEVLTGTTFATSTELLPSLKM